MITGPSAASAPTGRAIVPVESRRLASVPTEPAGDHPGLVRLSSRFERRGIRWCQLERRPLPGRDGGDLRVLVEPSDLDRAEYIVWAVGGIAARTGARGPHRRIWFLRDAATGATVRVHVTTRLATHLGEEASRRIVHGVLVNRSPATVPSVAETESFWLLLLRALRHRRPATGELVRLRSLARRAPVASSPLAEVVTSCVAGDWTVTSLLAVVERGGPVPRLRTRAVPSSRRPRGTARSDRPPRTTGRLAMTVAVASASPGRRPVLPRSPAWPLPVEVIDAGVPARPDGAASVTQLLGPLRSRLRWLRRRAARDGALLLLDDYPYELLTRPTAGEGRWAGAVRRAGIRLLPRPDAIALLEARSVAGGDEDAPADVDAWEPHAAVPPSPAAKPPCPVLSLGDSPESPSPPDRLGLGLWELLRWRMASSGFPDPPSLGSRRVGQLADGDRVGGASAHH